MLRALGLCTLLVTVSANAQSGVRIAVWNIETIGLRGEPQYDAALAVLARIDADIVALNEIEGDADAPNLDDLAEDAGYPFFTIPDDNPLGEDRNAFLSRFPLTETINTSESLSGETGANDITRLLLEVRADLPSPARDIVLIVNHWKSGTGNANEFRRVVESTRMIQAISDLDPSTDMIVALGDMNEELDSVPQTPNPITELPTGLPTSYELGDDLEDILAGSGFVNDPFEPFLSFGMQVVDAVQLVGGDGTRPESGRRLDYIIVSPALAALGIRAEVYDSADEGSAGALPKSGAPLDPDTSIAAADHFLVFADIGGATVTKADILNQIEALQAQINALQAQLDALKSLVEALPG